MKKLLSVLSENEEGEGPCPDILFLPETPIMAKIAEQRRIIAEYEEAVAVLDQRCELADRLIEIQNATMDGLYREIAVLQAKLKKPLR